MMLATLCCFLIVAIPTQLLAGQPFYQILLAAIAMSIVTLGLLWSISIRRVHDLGYPDASALLLLVPLVGSVFLLQLLLVDSERGSNEYGNQPFGKREP